MTKCAGTENTSWNRNKNALSIPDNPIIYDYIVAGLGCAGMSLLMHMIASGRFAGKKILAVDKERKNRNDRTWCFWEKESGFFEPVVSHRWQRLIVRGNGGAGDITEMDIRPYSYKMIRATDFYSFCMDRIASCAWIDIRYGQVENVSSKGIVLDGEFIPAGWVFSSIVPPAEPQPGRFRLLQHFMGREIETAESVFSPGCATLMDFRVSQHPGTAFVYVMPFSPTRALVEYTVFSPAVLTESEYARALDDYIGRYLTTGPVAVRDTEFGVIPMTNERPPGGSRGLTYTGTAGGRTKPSSGYTFSFIQRQSVKLVRDIVTTGYPQPEKASRRFLFYDSVLLNVLATGKQPGDAVFSRLFNRNSPLDIFAFLGNESDWKQDLRILGSLPLAPFARAGWSEAWSLMLIAGS